VGSRYGVCSLGGDGGGAEAGMNCGNCDDGGGGGFLRVNFGGVLGEIGCMKRQVYIYEYRELSHLMIGSNLVVPLNEFVVQ
jgi:hypothetical protein